VAHAILDALGPVARRFGCVGPAFAASARVAFDCVVNGGLTYMLLATSCNSCNKCNPREFRHTSSCHHHHVTLRAWFIWALVKGAHTGGSSSGSGGGGGGGGGGLCPKVAKRFSVILRLSAAQVLDAGAAAGLAELVAADISAAAAITGAGDLCLTPGGGGSGGGGGVGGGGGSDGRCGGGGSGGGSGGGGGGGGSGGGNTLADRTDTLESRAGAVVELLMWAGEAEHLAPDTARVLMQACVEAGAASAAESLARALPAGDDTRSLFSFT